MLAAVHCAASVRGVDPYCGAVAARVRDHRKTYRVLHKGANARSVQAETVLQPDPLPAELGALVVRHRRRSTNHVKLIRRGSRELLCGAPRSPSAASPMSATVCFLLARSLSPVLACPMTRAVTNHSVHRSNIGTLRVACHVRTSVRLPIGVKLPCSCRKVTNL